LSAQFMLDFAELMAEGIIDYVPEGRMWRGMRQLHAARI